jgi:hypothetical protein
MVVRAFIIALLMRATACLHARAFFIPKVGRYKLNGQNLIFHLCFHLMKNHFSKLPLVLVLSLVVMAAGAQTPKPGKYQSADGRYTISIGVTTDGSIEVKEPNKVSVYAKSGEYFRHSDPKYAAYLIRVGTSNDIYTLKEGANGEFRFNWVSSEEISAKGCELYDKYLGKATEAEGNEVQAWTFCAAAAKAKCESSNEAFREQAIGIATTLKLIIVKDECPCSDVIPSDIWANK